MSRPVPTRTPRLGAWPIIYWGVALLAYATLGAFFQPFFLLGFWESIPFLLVATWLAGRLFGGNGPVRPTPPAGAHTDEVPPA